MRHLSAGAAARGAGVLQPLRPAPGACRCDGSREEPLESGHVSGGQAVTTPVKPDGDGLWWALLAGAVLIVLGFAFTREAKVEEAGIAAVVDGVPVPQARVDEIAAGMQGNTADARDALTRAIDESLWLRSAWAQGLVQRRADVRDALVAEAQAALLERNPVRQPTEAELRALYARSPERFRQLSGMRVQRWTFSPSRGGMRSAWARATEAYQQLASAKGGVPQAVATLADPVPSPLGDGVMSLPQMRKAIGPEATILVAQLGDGEHSRPVQHDGAIHIYRMIARDAAIVPPFEAVGPRIADEFVLQARERILLAELQRLRTEADVRVLTDPAPVPAPDRPR